MPGRTPRRSSTPSPLVGEGRVRGLAHDTGQTGATRLPSPLVGEGRVRGRRPASQPSWPKSRGSWAWGRGPPRPRMPRG